MTESVSTYGNGNWLLFNNANAAKIENKKHGKATNFIDENAKAYSTFDKLLNDDNAKDDVTIFVSNRTEKNEKGKELAGLSYDLADMFMKAAEKGLIKDDDGDGFTRKNATALGKKIAELDGKQENYMDDTFRTMGIAKKPKDHRTYTRAEIEELMAAAGYSRATAPKEEKVVVPPAPVKVEEKKEEEITGGDGKAVTQTNEVLEKFLGKEAAAKYIDFKYTGVEKQTVNGTEAYIVSFSNGEETITVSKNRAEIEKLIKENPEFKKDLFDGALPLGKKDSVEQTKTEAPKAEGPAKPKKNAYYSKALFGGAFLNKADKAAHDQGKLDYMIDKAAYYQAQGDEAKADKIMKKAVKYSEKHNVMPSVSKK